MKSTGVVRRLDELGRIVIPKEIRKRLKIDSSDLVDIYIDEENIVLKKYHPLDNSYEYVFDFCKSIKETYNVDIVLSDKNKIIYNTYDEMLNNCQLDEELIKRIDSYLEKEISSLAKINLTRGFAIKKDIIIYKIMANNEHYGYLFLLDDMISKRQKELGKLILNFFNYVL